MSLMEQVREIGADQGRMPEESIRTARSALQREIVRSRRRAHGVRRRRAGLGIGGLVAAAAATAIVVGSVIAPIDAPDAAAADVLEDAARTVLTDESAPGAGQYTRIEETTESLVTNAPNGVPRDPGADAGFIERVTTVYYVPADRGDDWFIDTTAPREIVDMIGEGADEFLDRVRAGGETRTEAVDLYPGGIQGGAPIDPYRDDYDTLPRDPERLLDWARGQAPGYESKVLMDLVWLDLAPKDLRSASYQALALLPGFSVVDTDGDLTTLERSDDIGDGETLVASLVIDTATGQLRSYASSVLQAGGDGIAPEGVPDMRMTFTTTVVESAP